MSINSKSYCGTFGKHVNDVTVSKKCSCYMLRVVVAIQCSVVLCCSGRMQLLGC